MPRAGEPYPVSGDPRAIARHVARVSPAICSSPAASWARALGRSDQPIRVASASRSGILGCHRSRLRIRPSRACRLRRARGNGRTSRHRSPAVARLAVALPTGRPRQSIHRSQGCGRSRLHRLAGENGSGGHGCRSPTPCAASCARPIARRSPTPASSSTGRATATPGSGAQSTRRIANAPQRSFTSMSCGT